MASGDDGLALARRRDADVAVNGRRDDLAAAARHFASDGLDAALLTAGGETANQALTALRGGWRVVYPNGVEPEPQARPDVKVQRFDGDTDAEIIEKLNRLIESGPFEVQVARTFPWIKPPQPTGRWRLTFSANWPCGRLEDE